MRAPVSSADSSNRPVIVGAALTLLVLVALCPKLVTLFVLLPEPVKAAMLFYVSGFIMAQGCQLVTARLLDTRRMLIVAFGLSAGIAVAVAPQAFVASLPALASPLSVGAMVAFVVNLVTLPLVSRRVATELPLDARAGQALADWVEGVAGAWALKRQTARAVEQALSELVEILAERGLPRVGLQARLAEDRIEITLAWTGEPLPPLPDRARPEDLLGPVDARERFAVWLATRQAQEFKPRASGEAQEVWMAFED